MTLPAVEGTAAEPWPELTISDVAEHDHEESCWLVIEDKVYDITEFLPIHPTPPSIVSAWCGGEATEAMRNKGGIDREHARAAWDMLESYQIGVLADG